MFSHEGTERTEQHNRLLAGSLSFVAGYVNAASFALLGAFTSHVTGNVGRLAERLAVGDWLLAAGAAGVVWAFFLGAFLASVALESDALPRRPHVYGALLLGEACLLGAFLILDAARWAEAGVFGLSMAMGLQNSLITRLSGAVVRTTHLTGVVTDLGIEAARWLRDWRARTGARLGVRLMVGTGEGRSFRPAKSLLLLTILCTFVLGGALGALLSLRLGRGSLLLPAAVLAAGGVWGLATGRDILSERDRTHSRR